MGKIEVLDFFKKYNFNVELYELTDSSTVVKAAESLNVITNDIGKTLSFIVDNNPIIIVLSGDAKVDNVKYKNYFNVKAKMIAYDDVNLLIGHPVGGVCPFGVKDNVKIYLDESLKQLSYVYPAAGDYNLALKIKIEDLQKLTKGIWVDVSK